MHQGFYHVLFLVLKHFWFSHNAFEICLCETCMEEDGKQHPLDGSLLSLKLVSHHGTVKWDFPGVATLALSRLNRRGWTQREHSTCQRTLSRCKWAARAHIGLPEHTLGCSDLSFRLSCADVPLICGISLSPWVEEVTYQALGARHSL